jgi:hypothetical protein
VQYLVEKIGMKVNQHDSPTPMELACYTANDKQQRLKVLRYLVRSQGYHQGHTLHYAAMHQRLDVVKYCIAEGANVEHRTDYGCTALHFVTAFPLTDDSIATVDTLLQHGANPLAFTDSGTALHTMRSCTVASHLLERDYRLACDGREFDPTAARKMLCARNKKGQVALAGLRKKLDALLLLDSDDDIEDGWIGSPRDKQDMQKLVEYVESWSCSILFVPTYGQFDHDLSIMPNPHMSNFQEFLAKSLCRHLEKTAIGEVACVVLGYLAPLDILEGWEQWELSAGDPPKIWA